MKDAGPWAKEIVLALRDAYMGRAESLVQDMAARTEKIVRQAQIDAVEQCLRIAHQRMNEARPLQHLGMGKIVDGISDLAIDLTARNKPSGGPAT